MTEGTMAIGIALVAILAAFVIGAALGGMAIFIYRGMMATRQLRIAQRKAVKTVGDAQMEAKDIVHEAKEEASKIKTAANNEAKDRRSELQKQENRLAQKMESLESKLENIDSREQNLLKKEKEVESTQP